MTVDLYYKCLHIPLFMEKITHAICFFWQRGRNYAAEIWLYKFVQNILIPSLPVLTPELMSYSSSENSS